MRQIIYYLSLLFLLLFSSWAILPLDLHAIDLSHVTFKDGDKIGIYRGSFDPIHLGHDEVIRNALKYGGMDYVIVIPLLHFNRYKPKMSPHYFRREVIQKLYENEPKILTTPLNEDEVLAYLRDIYDDRVKLTSIIGSDVAIQNYQDGPRKHKRVDEWLVVLRDGDRGNQLLPFIKLLDKLPVRHLADPTQLLSQNFSSSQVRAYLENHPEFYQKSSSEPSGRVPSEPSIQELPLAPVVREMIRRDKRFQVNDKTRDGSEFRDKILRVISEKVDPELNKGYRLESIPKVNQGKSGDLVYSVKDRFDHTDYIVKVFVGEGDGERFLAEESGFLRMKNLDLDLIQPAQQIFSSVTDEFNIIGMLPVRGHSLKDLMLELNQLPVETEERQKALDRSHKLAQLVGGAMAELHLLKRVSIPQPVVSGVVENSIKKLERNLGALIQNPDHFRNARAIQLLQAEALIETPRFYAQRGFYSFTHGDASIGHFFTDPDLIPNSKVQVIDLFSFGQSVSRSGSPQGLAGYDFHQYLSSISFTVRELGLNLNPTEIEYIKEGFRQGYFDYYKTADQEVSLFQFDFFDLYWRVKSF